MATQWTDETKAALIKAYLAENPTPKTSMEIVNKLAKEFDATANGTRIILSKANVYIKKDAVASTSSTTTSEKKETKQESLDRLTAAIEALGLEADDSIVSKLTGKAAAYFADVINKATETEE